MITDTNQAWFAKMTGRRVQEGVYTFHLDLWKIGDVGSKTTCQVKEQRKNK